MLKTGTQVGAYVVVDVIAAGGMAVVYRAVRIDDGSFVALKVLLGNLAMNERTRTRFAQGAWIQGQLEHPNILQVFPDFVLDEQYTAFAMKLVDGPSLADLLGAEAGRSPWPLDRVMTLMVPVLKGVAHAHRRGVVHRDLKPGNILLPRDDDGLPDLTRPLIVDFDLARLTESDSNAVRTREGSMLGTPPYMAPEQFRGDRDIGRSADVHAIGMMIWELLVGRLPVPPDDMLAAAELYTGRTLLHRLDHLQRAPSPVAELVARSLATHRQHRFTSAGDMLSSLQDAIAGDSPPPSSLPPARFASAQRVPNPSLPPEPVSAPPPEPVSAPPPEPVSAPPPEPVSAPPPEPVSAPPPELVDSPQRPDAESPPPSRVETLPPVESALPSTSTPAPTLDVEALVVEDPIQPHRPASSSRIAVGVGITAVALAAVAGLALTQAPSPASTDPTHSTQGGHPRTTLAVNAVAVDMAVTLTPATLTPTGMVLVKGGSVQVGCDSSSTACANGRPNTSVSVDDFLIDRFEVTADAYSRCVADGACGPVSIPKNKLLAALCNSNDRSRQNHPANCLTYTDAMTYCASVQKRLPTEDEWEAAARMDGGAYPWGNASADCSHAVHNARGGFEGIGCATGGTWPVGAMPGGATSTGIADLSGNVTEWVDAAPGGLAANKRVAKGGDFARGLDALRPGSRTFEHPRTFDIDANAVSFGVRCARDP